MLVAVAVGLAAPRPARWAAGHHGIDALLVILVAATAVGVDVGSLRRLPAAWRSLAASLLVGVTALPALAWVLSRAVAAGPLRNGVLAAALAPCEIASVATTGMAGGSVPLAAGVLIGSTALTIGAAGPILSLLSAGAAVPSGHLASHLAVVVAAPLAAGLLVAWRRPLHPRGRTAASRSALVALALLVLVVVGEVHLSVRYVAAVAVLAAFVFASAIVGVATGRLARGRPDGERTAVLLTVSMRDFAIAAGLATAAFGPVAAAPLGAYGVLVLVWGTACAGRIRARSA